MIQPRWIPWFALMLLCACAPNVAVDYDKSADFSRYRTYGWGKGMPAKNPTTDQEIVKVIDEQLARKGLTKAQSDPDLVVAYHAATHEEVDYNEASFTSGSGPAYGSLQTPSSSDAPMRVKVGTVIVDLYDSKEKRRVWHGVASDIVPDSQGKMAADIEKGAAKMFENFPPRQ